MQRKSYLSLSIIILSAFFASHCMHGMDTISFESTTAGRRRLLVPHINGSTYDNIPLPSNNIDNLFYFYDKDSRHFLIINKENLIKQTFEL